MTFEKCGDHFFGGQCIVHCAANHDGSPSAVCQDNGAWAYTACTGLWLVEPAVRYGQPMTCFRQKHKPAAGHFHITASFTTPHHTTPHHTTHATPHHTTPNDATLPHHTICASCTLYPLSPILQQRFQTADLRVTRRWISHGARTTCMVASASLHVRAVTKGTPSRFVVPMVYGNMEEHVKVLCAVPGGSMGHSTFLFLPLLLLCLRREL